MAADGGAVIHGGYVLDVATLTAGKKHGTSMRSGFRSRWSILLTIEDLPPNLGSFKSCPGIREETPAPLGGFAPELTLGGDRTSPFDLRDTIEIVPPPGWPICKCRSEPGVRCAIADQGLICPILLADVHGRPPFALSGRSISVTGDCERSTSNALAKTSSIRAVTMTARNRRSIGVKPWPPASFHVGRG